MKVTILTLFPDFFQTPLQASILKRAIETQAVEFNIVNIRDYATDKHKVTDDRPYGGGPGMVLKVDPIHAALQDVLGMDPAVHRLENLEKNSWKTWVILTSAKGKVFSQPSAQKFSTLEHLVIICGHYEGVDERVADHLIDEEVRIGDYVLTGGEPAALVMTDAVVRLLPGVLGNDQSTEGESHSSPGFLAHPQYTRPVEFKGWKIPEILLTGHHAQITDWRQQKAGHDQSLPERTPED
jgi:tRNA (guanine37-N1)-methyltransferase